MKLIMESWRKWVGSKKDFPSDGHKPIDRSSYNVHQGGGEEEIPRLNPPDEHPPGAPIKNRKTIHHLSPNAREIINPSTGEIDSEKLEDFINNTKSQWGPEGDPERDEWLSQRTEDMQAAIEILQQEHPKTEEEKLKMQRIEDRFAEVQALIQSRRGSTDTEPHNIFASDEEDLARAKTISAPPPLYRKSQFKVSESTNLHKRRKKT